jgi:hypothetical protein
MKWLEEETWSWNENPFLETRGGQRALAGLKVVMMLTSNWDAKDGRDEHRGANTSIYLNRRRAQPEHVYSFDDWGASMGKWGSVWTREKWDAEHYMKQTDGFVEGVEGDFVKWGYDGTHEDDIKDNITVKDVRWIYRYLGRITEKQLREGLIASGAEPEEIAIFVPAIRQRLDQLKQVAHGSTVLQRRIAGARGPRGVMENGAGRK